MGCASSKSQKSISQGNDMTVLIMGVDGYHRMLAVDYPHGSHEYRILIPNIKIPHFNDDVDDENNEDYGKLLFMASERIREYINDLFQVINNVKIIQSNKIQAGNDNTILADISLVKGTLGDHLLSIGFAEKLIVGKKYVWNKQKLEYIINYM